MTAIDASSRLPSPCVLTCPIPTIAPPSSATRKFGQVLSVQEETWVGDRLQFRIVALGQTAAGTIDVAEDHARLEVTLPWLLAPMTG